jgi:hypothetical protein
MTEGDIQAEQKRIRLRGLLAALLFAFVLLATSSQAAPPSTDDSSKTGTLADLRSDKRVVQNGRWFLVREFTVEFAIRDSETYCGELTTTDATEAHDLIDSRGQTVAVLERGKDLYLTLKNGRHIKTHRLTPDRCPRG